MSIGSNNIFAPANETEGKLRVMPKPETLASFITRVKDKKKLTYQAISNASGNMISPNYVYNLANGSPTTSLGVDIIQGLAKGLGESPIDVFCFAVGLTLKLKDDSLRQTLEDYSALSKDDQGELRLLMETLKREIYERTKRQVR